MNYKNLTHYFAIAVVAIAGFAISPAGQAVVSQYPKLSGIFAGVIALAALYHQPKVAATILLALALLASPAMAQTNIAAPPTFHFVTGGSAINFNSPQGNQVGSIAYVGIQVTPSFTTTYEHITVPSISARYELGVLGYTKPLSSLLGSTLTSKLLFDASNINVTFQGGAGKLLSPTANHIAETFGVSLSYPIPGTSAAIQVLGYQWIHSPAVWGTVQKNYSQQLSTGLVVYF